MDKSDDARKQEELKCEDRRKLIELLALLIARRWLHSQKSKEENQEED